MFEELLTVSSNEEDDDDIKIVEERLNEGRRISSPRKIQEIVSVLSQQGHLPRVAAAKVRNVQFFSAQGPLSSAWRRGRRR